MSGKPRVTAYAQNGNTKTYTVNNNGQMNKRGKDFLASNGGASHPSLVPKKDRAGIYGK